MPAAYVIWLLRSRIVAASQHDTGDVPWEGCPRHRSGCAEAIGKAIEELRSAGHTAIGVTCDVTDRAQVAAMVEQVVSSYGRLDATFNNAGINTSGAPLLDTSDEEFERIINVNLRGVWNCMKAQLRQMVAQGSGAIVNCSSIGGMVGSKGRSA
jgi:NAD(P)-dependent dehydrogenase (short-subunit alcohol dehydrogenase family)